MKLNLRLSQEGKWIIDRVLLCVLAVWALSAVTCHRVPVAPASAVDAKKLSMEKKIDQIYRWCEESLAPAENDKK